jgi:hypothetical protein
MELASAVLMSIGVVGFAAGGLYAASQLEKWSRRR